MQDLTPDRAPARSTTSPPATASAQDAVATLLRAVLDAAACMAQFSHPELGGMGQWSQGGMIMIGDMFNNGLK